jgi:hypothetical protein
MHGHTIVKNFHCRLLLPYSANIRAYNHEVLALDIVVKVMERWLTVTHRTARILITFFFLLALHNP